ncbi:MAG: 5-methyltetrahydropteroyltriglutamate--homocysteine S-methyltransferase [Parachlamydiaceae bacterium]|nr:5-methyltetrahydropteroyltriglutamate--homocysteine S-methyltransferase [Parachlamydiaceae bacterium]
MVTSHHLGFPRIGLHREMKKAVEAYWAENIDEGTLHTEGVKIRAANWALQAQAPLDWLSVGDFSWYDHVLDMSTLLGVIPERFGPVEDDVDLDTYFRMARGSAPNGEDIQACEMTKWFDTNYHYIVPEFTQQQQFKISSQKLFNEIEEAHRLNHPAKPVIIGPLTYLWLGKVKDAPSDFDRLSLLTNLIPIYKEIFARLEKQKITWIQIDEPILVLDLSQDWKEAFKKVYLELNSETNLSLMVTTYFAGLENNLQLACQLPVSGLHVDMVCSPEQLKPVLSLLLKDKVLSLGMVDGRNIWRTDLTKALTILKPLKESLGDRLWIGSSSSLLHSPVDLKTENSMNMELKDQLSFAVQKIEEIVLLTDILNSGEAPFNEALKENKRAVDARLLSQLIHDIKVKERSTIISPEMLTRKSPYAVRKESQQADLNLPLFPTTTIGSFPQTTEIRTLHRDFKSQRLNPEEYKQNIQRCIADLISWQEKIDLDVLVHGEMERSDMVEYFAPMLNGFAITENGWVQSYGSRCVKPPIIFGDVSRPAPMTIEWITFAQSLTKKPVKGMLTGPITIIRWSFIRDDQSPYETAKQIALALRDEVLDLEKGGIKVIQIDEPAFREGLPLRQKDWQKYLDEAVTCFRLVSCGVQDKTQIHTHMCYSEFNHIIDGIARLDADVISIEASRSDMELLKAFETFHYPNQIGPGVYDIHSPQIPTVEEIFRKIEKATASIPISQLWINPDCGLKTRSWPETEAGLENMVKAAKLARQRFSH